MNEKAFQTAVVRLAGQFGWKVYHTWLSIHSAAGFPDLVLARERDQRLIFAELKGDKGKLSAAQQDWLATLKVCGMETYSWWPSDVDALAEILR